MKSKEEIIAIAKQTILIEGEAVNQLNNQLNEDFSDLVSEIINLKGLKQRQSKAVGFVCHHCQLKSSVKQSL